MADMGISNLSEEVLMLPSFNTHAIKHLLNNLGGIGTKYLECGLHKAGGFICAQYHNQMKAVGIDNWSEFQQDGESKKIAFELCEKHLDPTSYKILDMDCFDATKSLIGSGFDMFTYDANHSFEAQYKAIGYFLSFMKNEFILNVDDTEWADPKEATEKAIKDLGLTVLFRQHLFDGQMGGKWWNGFTTYYLKK